MHDGKHGSPKQRLELQMCGVAIETDRDVDFVIQCFERSRSGQQLDAHRRIACLESG